MANAGIVQQMSGSLAGGGFAVDDGGGGRRRPKRHKGGSQRRKIEKAQEHLRSRMQQRLNGPAMVSSRLQKAGVSTGGGNIQIHDDGKAGDMLRVKTFKGAKRELEKATDFRFKDANKQLNGNYWRTQQDRYSNYTHSSGTGNRTRNSQDDVPLHELVDKVLRRKEQKNNISAPLTIRAYQQPKEPFGIQQQPMIKKMVGGQTISTSRKRPKNKGPYFVVLHRENPEKLEGHSGLGSIRGKSLDNSVELDINTWQPELDNNARGTCSSVDEDRCVTNYKLQMQHAARLAEARFDYSNSSKKMQTFNALPPINSKLPQEQLARPKGSLGDSNSDKNLLLAESDEDSTQNNRTQSSDKILKAMKDIKRSKRKPSGNDFNTILRTRNRYTAKTKQFKEGLTRARALSAIDEDQSSISSERSSRCTSGRRPSQSSIRSLSAQSLNSIEETKTPEPDDTDIRNAKEKQKADIRNANEKQKAGLVDRRTTTDIIEEDEEEYSDEDDAVFKEEPLVSSKSASASRQRRDQTSPEPSLTFSSSSNPLPPIQIKGASPTNHDRDNDETSTQIYHKSLPTIPVVPEIRKSSRISDAAA